MAPGANRAWGFALEDPIRPDKDISGGPQLPGRQGTRDQTHSLGFLREIQREHCKILRTMSVKYRIQVFKDGKAVTANFDVRVNDMSSTELLSDFHLIVDGQNLTSEFQPGQKEYVGLRNATLKFPSKDALVTFDISTNEDWEEDGSDTLRGSKLRDDCLFEN